MFVLEEDLEESIDDEESSNDPVDDVSSGYFETIEAGRDSLKDGFDRAEEVIPRTETHRRLTPSVTLLPTGQLVFSRAFDVFLGKSKTEPLGTHNNLLFKWGFYKRYAFTSEIVRGDQVGGDNDGESEIIDKYEPVWGHPRALFVQCLDKVVEFRSLPLSSKWPKNILSVRSVLESIQTNPSLGRMGDYRMPMYRTSYKKDDSEKVWYDKLKLIPQENEKYVFTGDSLILSEVDKTCALLFCTHGNGIKNRIKNSIGDSKTQVTFTESIIPFDPNDLDRHRDIPF